MFLLVSDWLFLLVSGWLFQADSNNESEIAAFEAARKYLTELHPDKNFTPSQELKERKANLKELIKQEKSTIQEIGNQEKELQIASENVDAILDQQPMQEHKKTHEEELS